MPDHDSPYKIIGNHIKTGARVIISVIEMANRKVRDFTQKKASVYICSMATSSHNIIPCP